MNVSQHGGPGQTGPAAHPPLPQAMVVVSHHRHEPWWVLLHAGVQVVAGRRRELSLMTRTPRVLQAPALPEVSQMQCATEQANKNCKEQRTRLHQDDCRHDHEL